MISKLRENLKNDKINIIFGAASTGKTLLSAKLALNIAEEGLNVLFVSNEISPKASTKLFARVICGDVEIKSESFKDYFETHKNNGRLVSKLCQPLLTSSQLKERIIQYADEYDYIIFDFIPEKEEVETSALIEEIKNLVKTTKQTLLFTSNIKEGLKNINDNINDDINHFLIDYTGFNDEGYKTFKINIGGDDEIFKIKGVKVI